jgi:hypothetical protein
MKITHNLTRAAGCLASAFHAKARGATPALPTDQRARPPRQARRGHFTLHLPAQWP